MNETLEEKKTYWHERFNKYKNTPNTDAINDIRNVLDAIRTVQLLERECVW